MTTENNKVKWAYRVFRTLIILANAVFTFSFFFDYMTLGQQLLGELGGAVLAGLIGVLIFDAGHVIWQRIRLYGAENQEQQDIADIIAWVDFFGSAVASVALLLLSSEWVTLNQQGVNIVGWASLIIISLVLVGNFLAMGLFNHYSNQAKDARIAAQHENKLRKDKEKEMETLNEKMRNERSIAMEELIPIEAARVARADIKEWKKNRNEVTQRKPEGTVKKKRKPATVTQPAPTVSVMAATVKPATVKRKGDTGPGAPCWGCGESLPLTVTKRRKYCDNKCHSRFHSGRGYVGK